jgi:O-antigen/teichoic acid export membrane protein
VSLFALALAAFANLDIFLLKALLGSNEQVGFYTAAVVLVKIPYLLLVGLTTALFPVVAQSLQDPTYAQTKFYIGRSLRYALLLLTPIGFLVVTTSRGLISLIYTSQYISAADPLRILIFGYVFASFFVITSTIIMAVGKPRIAMGLAFLMIGCDVVLNYALIPKFGLNGAALATSVTAFIGAFGGLAYVFRRFGRLMNPVSFVIILGVSIAISLPCVFFDVRGMWLLIYYAVVIVLYFVLLTLLKEIGGEEWSVLKGVCVLLGLSGKGGIDHDNRYKNDE